MNSSSPRLLITPRSPFSRRVRLAMMQAGYAFEEEVVDPFQPTENFLKANPLGLVPVLLRVEGDPIADSSLILDYLDEVAFAVWPKDPLLRLEVRSVSVLCSGVMMAAVNYFFESRKTVPATEWLEDYLQTVPRILAEIDRRLQNRRLVHASAILTQAGWDLAVALEYLDLRMPNFNWRGSHPSFVPVLEEARASRCFTETSPPAQ